MFWDNGLRKGRERGVRGGGAWHHWSPTVFPTSSSQHIRQAIIKQNHRHMQKVTTQVQLWPRATHIHTALQYLGSPVTTASPPHATMSETPRRAQESCRAKEWERIQPPPSPATALLTFRRHPVFVRTAGQAAVVGVQAGHVTRAVTARRRTSTLLLVGTRSICRGGITRPWSGERCTGKHRRHCGNPKQCSAVQCSPEKLKRNRRYI